RCVRDVVLATYVVSFDCSLESLEVLRAKNRECERDSFCEWRISRMKSAFVLSLLFFVIASSIASPFAADTIPAWQVTWESTVAASKKEGRLNFYVGRYGSEPLLNEFR